jgi:hypothetical protein
MSLASSRNPLGIRALLGAHRDAPSLSAHIVESVECTPATVLRHMKVYCEHGGLSRALRSLQRNGYIELVHFPYDPTSGSSYIGAANTPSEAQLRDLNLPLSELPGSWNNYSGSEHLSEIREILGPQNRQDALHVDTAFKSGCSAFVTRDNGILVHRERLQAVLGIRFFHPDTDADELERYVSRDYGAAT